MPNVKMDTTDSDSLELVPWASAMTGGDADSLMVAAHLLIQGGHWRAAEGYLNHLLRYSACGERFVESRVIHTYLGFVLSRRGEYKRALGHYKEYEQLSGELAPSQRALLLNSFGNQHSGLGEWKISRQVYRAAIDLAPDTRGALYAEANLCVHAAHIANRQDVYQRCNVLMERFERRQDEVGYYFVLSMQFGLSQMLGEEQEVYRLADILVPTLERPVFRILQSDVYDTLITWYLENRDIPRAVGALEKLREVVAGDAWSHDGNWLLIRQAALMRVMGEPRAGMQLLLQNMPLFCSALTKVYGWAELANCARDLGDRSRQEQARTCSARLLCQLGASKQIAAVHVGGPSDRLTRGRGGVQRLPLDDYVGSTAALVEMRRVLKKLARTNCSILLTGESGTGKSLLAELVHRSSKREAQPFVRFDCACNDEGLLESVLFGHERGAFTGAVSRRRGLVELAEGGTLFIDEIGDLPVGLQAKLLTLLEEGLYRSVGASAIMKADVRFLLATNRSLVEAVKQRAFREDLMYRLGVEVRVPSLRERISDIPLLCWRFLQEVNGREGESKRFALGALELLSHADWPGNVRQVRRAVERGCYMSEGGEITAADCGVTGEVQTSEWGFRKLEEVERAHILEALAAASGNKSEAARLLGVKRTTLYSRIDALGLRCI